MFWVRFFPAFFVWGITLNVDLGFVGPDGWNLFAKSFRCSGHALLPTHSRLNIPSSQFSSHNSLLHTHVLLYGLIPLTFKVAKIGGLYLLGVSFCFGLFKRIVLLAIGLFPALGSDRRSLFQQKSLRSLRPRLGLLVLPNLFLEYQNGISQYSLTCAY